LDWYQPATGWIVISLTQWAFGANPAPYDGYAWLKSFDPVATIGKTVRLYYVDPAHSAAKVSAPDPTVVGNDSISAVLAARDMAAERHRAAALTSPSSG
jgi:hypothetical protein